MNASKLFIPIGQTGKLENNIALPYQFTIGNLLQESWKRVKGTKATYLGAVALYILIYGVLISVGMLITYLCIGSLDPELHSVSLFSAITRLVIALMIFPIPFGITLLALHRSVNHPVKAMQMFRAYHFYWKILGALVIIYIALILITIVTVVAMTFLSALIGHNAPHWLQYCPILVAILGGLFGIYVLFSMSYAPLLIMEKRFGVFQSIKTSFLAFRQHGLKIIAAYFCLFLIYLLGIIPLGIGLIWTLPLLFNGMGILYRIQFGVGKN